jgi:hypothetical protein
MTLDQEAAPQVRASIRFRATAGTEPVGTEPVAGPVDDAGRTKAVEGATLNES